MEAHSVGELDVLHIGEVEFGGGGDRRLGPLLGHCHLLLGSGILGGGRRSGGGDRGGLGIFALALARLEHQRHRGAGHPALHRGLHLARRQRGDLELAGEIVGIVGQHFARRR